MEVKEYKNSQQILRKCGSYLTMRHEKKETSKPYVTIKQDSEKSYFRFINSVILIMLSPLFFLESGKNSDIS